MVERIRTAKGRKVGSTAWITRQLADPYVKRARADGYRSRAAYKLIELDERFGFLRGAERVVDLAEQPDQFPRRAGRQLRAGRAEDAVVHRVPGEQVGDLAAAVRRREHDDAAEMGGRWRAM